MLVQYKNISLEILKINYGSDKYQTKERAKQDIKMRNLMQFGGNYENYCLLVCDSK
jgi:hypothetical protein